MFPGLLSLKKRIAYECFSPLAQRLFAAAGLVVCHRVDGDMAGACADRRRGRDGYNDSNDARQPTVSIAAPNDTVAEDEVGVFRISRNSSVGSLVVNLTVGGDAIFASDYSVSHADSFDTSNARVALPDGQAFAEIVVKVTDDIPAEADETITLTLVAGADYTLDAARNAATVTILQNDFIVTRTDDAGEGSLRQAIINANTLSGPDTITFDAKIGPFATPQTIALNSELPDLIDELVIDGRIPDRLWKPVGVTVSGERRHRVFTVPAGANVIIGAVTIADGRASDGGGIVNRGTLVVKDTTLAGNNADRDGGGLVNLGGSLTVINSTFANNGAGRVGGGLANIDGKLTVTNSTFSGNAAENGGGLFSNEPSLLRNTLFANSVSGGDCASTAALALASTNNLIETNNGCGTPISAADPDLEPLRNYNGPTFTFALRAGSAAINLGDNASAVG